ncbi:uncharacterized protein F5Z01DRAFT_502805 [Emericellopsis atlantica]|uniref:Uncharacterized protein n=1 Tax=Emericellopsis atlantica TaxID=2614577 RepID=A0A9P8CR24_9HYPO|nr:uncharacterized protein F5Z01DRAFT_502805 [Emericellopsis atlantica]KAG9256258.1 hypothetical protein F5Z01DRAFT_502805 [Emericellopsis atlantica]
MMNYCGVPSAIAVAPPFPPQLLLTYMYLAHDTICCWRTMSSLFCSTPSFGLLAQASGPSALVGSSRSKRMHDVQPVPAKQDLNELGSAKSGELGFFDHPLFGFFFCGKHAYSRQRKCCLSPAVVRSLHRPMHACACTMMPSSQRKESWELGNHLGAGKRVQWTELPSVRCMMGTRGGRLWPQLGTINVCLPAEGRTCSSAPLWSKTNSPATRANSVRCPWQRASREMTLSLAPRGSRMGLCCVV